MIVIRELSTSQMEVEIPGEHIPLGRDWCYRYAERLAQAATMDRRWCGTMLTSNPDAGSATIRLTRIE